MTTTIPKHELVGVETPASLVRDHAEHRAGDVSLRVKSRGVWREITWAGYWEHVETFAHALLAAGIDEGDRVAIHSENNPEWVYADVGSIAVRAVCMGLYPTNPSAEVEYLLADSGSRLLVVEDQEQADKVLQIPADKVPVLERIVYIQQRGVDAYDDPRLMSWDDFMATGREHRDAFPDAVSRRMAEALDDDLAYLVYTSGTTGPPKGSMLTVRNLQFAGLVLQSDGGIVVPPPGPDDLLVSYLPLCHIYEKLFSVVFSIWVGAQIHFGESIDTLVADMRDVNPTVVQGVPRIWERIHAAILVRLGSASRLKRINAAVWLKAGDRIGKTLVANSGKHTPLSRTLLFFGDIFLFRSLKERVGLRRCRYAVTAAAPIAPEILQYFMGIGVPLHEAYGMTENTAIATRNGPGRIELGTVGEPYPETELMLAPGTNEILTRHPGNFVGYWEMPEATAEAIDAEGWLHTGDVGEWVNGTHIRIVDRIKDIIITSGGKNVSPSEIENSLKTSPLVKEAIVIGDRRKYLTALIGIDFEIVSEWAQRKRLAHTTYRDLSEKAEVVALMKKVVEETNSKFSRVEQIKKFRLLTKELDHEDGELTATQKVKRSIIDEKFGDLIESMYQ